MQSRKDMAFDLQTRRSGEQQADRNAAPDARDRAIAELKSQVIFLRRELSRRDDVLMFLAGMVVGPRSGEVPELRKDPPGGPRKVPRAPEPAGGDRESARRKARGEPEKREWPPLPGGYRVVATASDAWVLVARGARIAGYRGILDPDETARDAWEHHRRNG